MKSQDVLLLFKLISIAAKEKSHEQDAILKSRSSLVWQDWKDMVAEEPAGYNVARHLEESPYSLRALENETGISKSQVSLSLKRCEEVALLRQDRRTGLPKVNETGLTELVVYGLKYCFPAKPAEVTRGIATSFAAPVLKGKLFTSGDLPWVWPDAKGNTKGQAISAHYAINAKLILFC